MSLLIDDPRTSVLDVTVSVRTAAIISRLAGLLDADHLDFSAPVVLRNAEYCLKSSFAKLPAAFQSEFDVHQEIRAAIEELTRLELISPAKAGGFTPAKRPALRFLSNLTEQAPAELVEAMGNMLIIGFLTDLPMPRKRCESLNGLSRASRDEPSLTADQTGTMVTLLNRSRSELLETLSQYLHTKDQHVLQFNSQVLNHFRSDLHSEHPSRQRDANTRRFLDGEELKGAIAKCVKEMINGELDALFKLLGFSLNLHEDLLRKVPLLTGDQAGGHIFWVDFVRGVACLDLQLLLKELGQPIAGCVQTRDILRLPFAQVLADHLKLAVALRPGARCVGDLLELPVPQDDALAAARTDASRAKLMRSGPSIAIRQSNNRAVAAYGFLAFHLLDSSDLHYLNISEKQIWRLRAEVFQSVALGELVPTEALDPGWVGSARTASAETVRRVFDELDSAVAAVKVGRRYSLKTLFEHHNRYAKRVGMYLQFVGGARASKELGFLASSWFFGALFGFLDDKDSGITGGRTPVVLTPATSRQLKLWEQHLTSLHGRLLKLVGPRAFPAVKHIEAVLQHKPVPLLFLLGEGGALMSMRTDYLFAETAKNMNHDWGRHVFASALTATDLPLADVHLFLRHQGGGINPQSAFTTNVQVDHLRRVALTIDQYLQELGILPLPGLAGGAA